MATVAITHIGLTGHVARAVRLGATLVRQGHEVHAWAPPGHRADVERTGARFHPSDPVPARSIRGGEAGFAAQLAEATEHHAGELIEQILACDAELVVYDYLAPWGRLAADFLGLPSIASWPVVPGLERAGAAGDATAPRGPRRPLIAAFPPGWEDSVARAAASRDTITRRWGIDLGPSGQPPVGPDDWAVSFTVPELLGSPRGPSRWRYVGPLLDPPPASPARPRERPLVYVSLGTFFTFVADVYAAVLGALGGEDLDVVLSTGRGWVAPEDLGPLPGNIVVHEFVDARQVLAEADVMVSHCGINSVHEALLGGVPLVCLPQAVDQFGWAERIERFGAGRAPEQTAPGIRAAVRALLDDDAIRRRAAALGRRLSEYDGPGEVRRLVADALGGRDADAPRPSAPGLPHPHVLGAEHPPADGDVEPDGDRGRLA